MQAMGYLMGGHVVPASVREYGKAHLRLLGREGLLAGVQPEADGLVTVWMSHGDTVLAPPPGFTSLAATDNCPVAAMADPARRIFAVQFHPEVAHTPQGKTVLKNFLDAAGAAADWSMPSFVDSAVEGGGRSAHVPLRGQRPPAEGRGRRGRPDLPRRLQDEPDPCRCK
jgi:GMP synthase (glutamine-hydrolysing)